MIVEGFCNVGRTDEPLDADGWCRVHGMVGIPPSWGVRTWRWVGGTWEPYKPRPEGYVYTPRFKDEPKAEAKPGTGVCHCGKAFAAVTRGGTAQAYCSSICRIAAINARRRDARGRQRSERAS